MDLNQRNYSCIGGATGECGGYGIALVTFSNVFSISYGLGNIVAYRPHHHAKFATLYPSCLNPWIGGGLPNDIRSIFDVRRRQLIDVHFCNTYDFIVSRFHAVLACCHEEVFKMKHMLQFLAR